ncbi:MAG: hypothetical protein IPG75_18175 [Gemmatimonadetes bacterium]|nr:hypothetical protein [Gemmatimonadota bacterium]
MARIRLRHPNGGQYSFESEEEFERALDGGRITQAWQVFHARGGTWLPLSLHPAFRRRRVVPEDSRGGDLPAA